MVQLSVPSPLPTSDLAYEESLNENEGALAKPSLLQTSPAPSLNLTSLQLQPVVASLSSRQKSLQQKELEAAYSAKRSLTAFTEQLCFKAQHQLGPTRFRELELSLAQLCFANSVWLKASKPACSMRTSQLPVDQLDAFRTGALQETGFQTGALPATVSKAALETAGFSAEASSTAATAVLQETGSAAAASGIAFRSPASGTAGRSTAMAATASTAAVQTTAPTPTLTTTTTTTTTTTKPSFIQAMGTEQELRPSAGQL